MKRFLLVPLLLTLIVGCGSKDKTYIERRDDCADSAAGKRSLDWIINKYDLASIWLEDEKYIFDDYQKQKTVSAFCSFYSSGIKLF